MIRKWKMRPPGQGAPEYDRDRSSWFTIELNFNGIVTPEEYQYGSVAMFDNIDPDFFSMLELAEMGNKVPLEGEYYQYLWLRPGRNFSDGLRPLEGEADILSLVEEMQAEAANFVRVFVKQLTLVQARNRMVEVYRELCKNGRPPAGGVILEELDV
ncbi:hypothetical protein LINGRAHAP2_LOCUS24333, partial [Linum grandiflorum]